MQARILLWAVLLSGCGENLMDEPIRAPESPPSPPVAAAPSKPKPPPGALFRQDVTRTVDEGLGYFLQRVAVEPELASGKFVGFRIVDLRPADFWQGVDLRPGDVVLRVNGMSIERDIDAYNAFESLRSAPSLRVTLVRGGARRELVYSILDPAGKLQPSAPKAAPPPEPPRGPSGKKSDAG